MKYMITFSLILNLMVITACEQTELPKPLPDFEYVITGDCSSPALEVDFKNNSQNATSYVWTFGDGTESIEFEPKKIYQKAGEYTVELKAFQSDMNASITKQIIIIRNSNGEGPKIDFSFSRNNATNLEMDFNIQSEDGEMFQWDFGDGLSATSDAKDVTHHYAKPGTYTILLIASNGKGSSCTLKQIQLSI